MIRIELNYFICGCNPFCSTCAYLGIHGTSDGCNSAEGLEIYAEIPQTSSNRHLLKARENCIVPLFRLMKHIYRPKSTLTSQRRRKPEDDLTCHLIGRFCYQLPSLGFLIPHHFIQTKLFINHNPYLIVL